MSILEELKNCDHEDGDVVVYWEEEQVVYFLTDEEADIWDESGLSFTDFIKELVKAKDGIPIPYLDIAYRV